ncbi:hypothetical protein PCK1_002753 [Pneumocystis canis]|nr:hypothetical protein PCK1_002753 [Pneumocystis canis]
MIFFCRIFYKYNNSNLYNILNKYIKSSIQEILIKYCQGFKNIYLINASINIIVFFYHIINQCIKVIDLEYIKILQFTLKYNYLNDFNNDNLINKNTNLRNLIKIFHSLSISIKSKISK